MNLRAVPICLRKGKSLARMPDFLLQRLESEMRQGTSLVVQWLRLHTPNAGDPGSIPGQGTRCHMPQLSIYMPQIKVLHTTTGLAQPTENNNNNNKNCKKFKAFHKGTFKEKMPPDYCHGHHCFPPAPRGYIWATRALYLHCPLPTPQSRDKTILTFGHL